MDQQPLLEYSYSRVRWEGEDREHRFFIWMTDATLQRYTSDYLASQQIYQPLLADWEDARDHCRKLSYWQGCTDPDVHVVPPGLPGTKRPRSTQLERKKDE